MRAIAEALDSRNTVSLIRPHAVRPKSREGSTSLSEKSAHPIQAHIEPYDVESELRTTPITSSEVQSSGPLNKAADELSIESDHELGTRSLQELSPSDQTSTSLQEAPHYSEAKHKLEEVFKLSTFRENQLEAIISTLEGRDVLVLMPTGGGKSLCYQLPAVCDGGRTQGVTVVISPLLALMNDQVDSLKRKGINVVLWSSETTNNDMKIRLCSETSKPRLLYITPEKLRGSGITQGVLSHLHRTNSLARFVVDEAHVISTWGQDFRDAVGVTICNIIVCSSTLLVSRLGLSSR